MAMYSFLSHMQNLGLEDVGVELDKNGAILVHMDSPTEFIFLLEVSHSLFFKKFLPPRLMNTLRHQLTPFGLLEMLQIG